MKLDDYYKTTNFGLETPNKTPIILNVIQLCYETMLQKHVLQKLICIQKRRIMNAAFLIPAQYLRCDTLCATAKQ
jgi:hypothetical protein